MREGEISRVNYFARQHTFGLSKRILNKLADCVLCSLVRGAAVKGNVMGEMVMVESIAAAKKAAK
jgi:hypothetical protein